MSKKLLLIVALLLSNMNFAFAAPEVNLNTATQAQLESIIPGDSTAKKVDAQLIISKRPFTSKQDFITRLSYKQTAFDQLVASGAVIK